MAVDLTFAISSRIWEEMSDGIIRRALDFCYLFVRRYVIEDKYLHLGFLTF
jgi:hypothetical protein